LITVAIKQPAEASDSDGGQTRGFDETAALDVAMNCFWHDGHEATAMRDLAARMGMTGANHYAAFGGKRERATGSCSPRLARSRKSACVE
jgi:AcrR family transcriptional regulator